MGSAGRTDAMKDKAAEPSIAAVELLRDRVPDFSRYPFCIPAMRNLQTLKLNAALRPVLSLVTEGTALWRWLRRPDGILRRLPGADLRRGRRSGQSRGIVRRALGTGLRRAGQFRGELLILTEACRPGAVRASRGMRPQQSSVGASPARQRAAMACENGERPERKVLTHCAIKMTRPTAAYTTNG